MNNLTHKNTDQLNRLGWRIWSAEGNSVIIDDDSVRSDLDAARLAGILFEDENGFRFADEHSMVEFAAQYVVQTEYKQLTNNPAACYKKLHEVWRNEIGKDICVSGHALAILHNSGEFDAYTWGRQAIETGVRVFDVLHVLEGAVIYFQNACAESIYQFFSSQHENVKNDMLGGILYPKLQHWFTQHPDIAHNIIGMHEKNPDECSASLYSCSMHGLILNDFQTGIAMTLIAGNSPDPMIAGPAIHTLGMADFNDQTRHSALNETIEKCANIIRTPNHPLLSTAVRTLCKLVLLDEDAIVGLLDEAGKLAAPEALYPISDFLWREEKTVSGKTWFWPLVLHLAAATTEHKGVLNNVDMMLMGWIKDPVDKQRALDFINTWISRQANDAFNEGGLEIYFESTMHRLAERPADMSNAISEWLLDEDSRYPMIAQKLVSKLRVEGITSFELAPAVIDRLNHGEILFLVRRILGYIVGDELLIGLIFSLVRTQNAKKRTFGFVASALQDQVGYDYPYQTIEFLKARQNDKKEKKEVIKLCNQMETKLQEHLDELDALPNLKEFQPSSVKVRRYSKERRHQMDESMEEASKKSIWMQIATRIPLKAGRRMFQTINGHYTDPTELQEMSHFVALPTREIADPAGAAWERVQFRRSKKDLS